MNKKNNFNELLDTTSLREIDKKAIKYLAKFLSGEQDSEFANRSFLFEGEPGIGKTFLVEQLIKYLNLPVLYLGQAKLEINNIKKLDSLSELLKEVESFKNGIVFMDDLRYILDFEGDYDEMDDKEKKRFMNLLEHMRKTNKEIALIMTLNKSFFIDDSWMDRIEVRIKFNVPSYENRFAFLKEKFGKYMEIKEIEYISKNTIGYSYRDLPQLIKIAYRESNKKIDLDCIKKALELYIPSGFRRVTIKRGIQSRFSDVIGHKRIKTELSNLILYKQEKDKLQDVGIKRANLFIFEGSPGVGKTFTATALAGELEVPLIKISATEVFRRNDPFENISMIVDMSKRFRDGILFLDDIDKIVGTNPLSFDTEGPEIAQLLNCLDDEEAKGIIILGVNNINRIGNALKDRCRVFQFPNPNQEDRKEFLDKINSKSSIKIDVDVGSLVQMTEGMSYREVQRVWNDCVFYYLQNKKLDLETMKEFVSEIKSSSGSFSINKLSMIG